jgi:F-type H+-transporting ATPase subunit a
MRILFPVTTAILFSSLAASTLSAADDKAGGVAPYSYKLFEVFGLPITNSMITGWVITLLVIVAVRLMVKTPQLVPTRGQAVIEGMVDGIRNLTEPIVGHKVGPKVFWLLGGFFFFILLHNWSGLLPGVGSFGFEKDGQFLYFMRPANSDLNTTLALAIIAQIAWIYYVFRYAGYKAFLFDVFGNKADKSEIPLVIYYFLTFIFIFVGLIEVVSILFRTVSLPFRLFGNVYGGENLLDGMTGLIPFLVPVPFYMLELLIGLIQALVFTLLVAVYIGLICNHDSGDEHAH